MTSDLDCFLEDLGIVDAILEIANDLGKEISADQAKEIACSYLEDLFALHKNIIDIENRVERY